MIIRGRVIRGDQKAAKTGFPTSNLKAELVKNKINKGVYAAQAEYGKKIHQAILVYGAKNKQNKAKLEIFILNFHQNLYKKIIRVRILNKIRSIMEFKNVRELKKQIVKDIKKAKRILNAA